MENTENTENQGTETSAQDRNSKIILAVLIGVIVIGLGYMLFGSSSHEKMRDPDASKANSTMPVEDTLSMYNEDGTLQEGIPEVDEKKKDEDEDENKTTTTSTTTTTATTATGAESTSPTSTADVTPSTPATAQPEAAPSAPKITKQGVKTKKIVEDVKEEKSEQATIDE